MQITWSWSSIPGRINDTEKVVTGVSTVRASSMLIDGHFSNKQACIDTQKKQTHIQSNKHTNKYVFNASLIHPKSYKAKITPWMRKRVYLLKSFINLKPFVPEGWLSGYVRNCILSMLKKDS